MLIIQKGRLKQYGSKQLFDMLEEFFPVMQDRNCYGISPGIKYLDPLAKIMIIALILFVGIFCSLNWEKK